jgi:mono/diheme cytochrome c family protein
MRLGRPALTIAVLVGGILAGFLGWSQHSTAKTDGADPKKAAHAKSDPHILSGKQVYAQYCATCHGESGKGDGPGGANLTIKPQNLADGRIMNVLPDHMLVRAVGEGPQSIGLSNLMPPFKPALSDAQISDVVAYIRTFAEPPYDPKGVLPVPVKREGPVQPIFFSHVIHAGAFKIDCQYCHTGARRSAAAGIPSVERCMGCHKIVAAQGNPEVQKLHGYWERREPIPWVRVFKVPEHAKFVHKNHIQAGLPCQTCHGRVEAMEQVSAGVTGQSIVNDLKNLALMPNEPNKLSMGWCVECHRAANGGQLASLSWIPKPLPKLSKDKFDAPLECVTCHH